MNTVVIGLIVVALIAAGIFAYRKGKTPSVPADRGDEPSPHLDNPKTRNQ